MNPWFELCQPGKWQQIPKASLELASHNKRGNLKLVSARSFVNSTKLVEHRVITKLRKKLHSNVSKFCEVYDVHAIKTNDNAQGPKGGDRVQLLHQRVLGINRLRRKVSNCSYMEHSEVINGHTYLALPKLAKIGRIDICSKNVLDDSRIAK